MSTRKDGPGRWSELAFDQLRGPMLTGVRRKLAAWRDPRARLVRRRRRAKQGATASAASSGVLGGGALLTAAPELVGIAVEPATDVVLNMTALGLGGGALGAGFGAISALRQYRRLKRTPLPEPMPEPLELPPSASRAREPMRRLRDAEASLQTSLTRLLDADSGVAGEPVSEARDTAYRTSKALRGLADRLVAVERAVPHAPGRQREELLEDVRRLGSELDEGVERYGGMVAAAGRAVAASGTDRQRDLMQDATDRLVGLAAAMQELAGRPGEPGPSPGLSHSPEQHRLPSEQPDDPERPSGRGTG